MNAREFFERALRLGEENEPFALATVVVRRSPVSSHLGDRAIVRADGTMEGFVGGACSRDVVVRHALEAMRTGRGRLLQIRTELPADPPAADESERIVIPMGCSSEGAVDVYVEPHLPRRAFVVAGQTPVAHEVARAGENLERFRIVRAPTAGALREALKNVTRSERERLVAVVATQGIFDEAALEALLDGPAPAYVGLLASRKRAAAVIGALAQQGVAPERLASVRAPAGLDIGARVPSEVAVSIVAEIVAALAASRDASPAAVAGEPEAHCAHCSDDANGS